MINDELKVLYGTSYGTYTMGDFDNVPEDSFVAEVVQRTYDADIVYERLYKFFIGDVYTVIDLLNKNINYSVNSKLESFIDDGYQYIVVPKNKSISDEWFYSFDVNNDRVFDDYDSFKNAISAVKQYNLKVRKRVRNNNK